MTIDIVERGGLQRLGRGTLWADRVTTDQHDTLIRLCAKGLAESVKAEPKRHAPGGVFFRITDVGRAELDSTNAARRGIGTP